MRTLHGALTSALASSSPRWRLTTDASLIVVPRGCCADAYIAGYGANDTRQHANFRACSAARRTACGILRVRAMTDARHVLFGVQRLQWRSLC